MPIAARVPLATLASLLNQSDSRSSIPCLLRSSAPQVDPQIYTEPSPRTSCRNCEFTGACGCRLAYDADRDSWSAEAFHAGVDTYGGALVVAETEGGAKVGGFNPRGAASLPALHAMTCSRRMQHQQAVTQTSGICATCCRGHEAVRSESVAVRNRIASQRHTVTKRGALL